MRNRSIDCTQEFSQSELMRCLDVKALERLDRIRAVKAIAAAGFECEIY